MKKLSKLKLHDVTLMSENEMKSIVGGAVSDYSCKTGSPCSVKFFDNDWNQTGTSTGTCQAKSTGNSMTCFCNAIAYDKPLLNESGMSHCFRGN